MNSKHINKKIITKKKGKGKNFSTKKNFKKNSLIKKGPGFFLIVFSIIGIGFLVYLGNLVAIYSLELPPTDTPFKRSLPESTVIYDDKGNSLYNIYGTDNRVYTPLSKIPKQMKMSMLAAEDIHFYDEDGINISAILRSLIYDLTKTDEGSLQGASTITQQLVKYAALKDDSRTYERKIKEIILTLKISKQYSKDQILEAYLNDVPFGGTSYGIEVAAKTYFNKDVSELDLAQCAFLAGLPQAPSVYSPLYAADKSSALKLSMERKNYVLDQLLKNKSYTGVTDSQIKAAKNETLTFSNSETLKYPHFVLYIRDELYKQFGKDYVNNNGLQVYTTLDSKIQDIAQEELTNGVTNSLKPIYGLSNGYNTHNGSLVAIDPTNGNVLAMVGSIDYNDTSDNVRGMTNMATSPSISPGSSIKPWVYLTGLQNGMTPDTTLHDTKTIFGDNGSGQGYEPFDWDNKYEGDIKLSQALLESRNIPAVEVANSVGVNKIYNNLILAGYDTLKPVTNYGLSLAIGGTNEVSLLEHTGAFQIFADNGSRHPIRTIEKVNDKYGKNIFDNTPIITSKVFDSTYTNQINSILKNYSTVSRVRSAGYSVAGKTGTSQFNKNNLFMGYSTNIVVGVWMGNTNQSPTTSITFGENTAGPVWTNFMLRVEPLLPKGPNL